VIQSRNLGTVFLTAAAEAQVTFNGLKKAVVSGLSAPQGVAVDGAVAAEGYFEYVVAASPNVNRSWTLADFSRGSGQSHECFLDGNLTFRTAPTGLKPSIDLIALIGPAEAVPLLQSLHLWSFVTACEALG